jgi:hypothetical protein
MARGKESKLGDGARIDIPSDKCKVKITTGLPSRVRDRRGEVHGRLTVQEFSGFYINPKSKTNRAVWSCECECGTFINVSGNNFRTTKSCGCLYLEIYEPHGAMRQDADPLYRKAYQAWESVIWRCTNPNGDSYPRYGLRGITVCDRWLNSFEAFFQDVGLPPSKAHSIDRLDNDGHYEPGNVRWATQTEQSNNRSTNHLVKLGDETKTIAEWCHLFELNPSSVLSRINRGCSPLESILTWPEVDEWGNEIIAFICPPGCEADLEEYFAKL